MNKWNFTAKKSKTVDYFSCANLKKKKINTILWLLWIFFLTLKWSRGIPMYRKISFRVSVQKRRTSLRCRFLTLTCLPSCIFWHVFEKTNKNKNKNHATRCAVIALGSLCTPRWPPTGRHSTKIIYNFPRDLWPSEAIHKRGSMILSYINTN